MNDVRVKRWQKHSSCWGVFLGIHHLFGEFIQPEMLVFWPKYKSPLAQKVVSSFWGDEECLVHPFKRSSDANPMS